MKKIVLSLMALALINISWGQSEKYIKAMQPNVAAVDTIRTGEGWAAIANTFQRIADAEKNQWLPYYYAALANVMHGYMHGQGGAVNAAKSDPLADKAEELLNKAEALSKDNSEIFIVRKMIATLRLMADPMNRFQIYGPKAAEALQKAKALNAENPRVYLLEGQDKFFTPEQFGGSKTQAKVLFDESVKKFESFKPASSLHPQWGKSHAAYFLSQIK